MIQRLVPDAKVTSIHGQMEGSPIETRMRDFIEGHIDILAFGQYTEASGNNSTDSTSMTACN